MTGRSDKFSDEHLVVAGIYRFADEEGDGEAVDVVGTARDGLTGVAHVVFHVEGGLASVSVADWLMSGWPATPSEPPFSAVPLPRDLTGDEVMRVAAGVAELVDAVRAGRTE